MQPITKQRKKLSLMSKILIGFILGILFGLVLPEWATHTKPLGDLFIRLLKMLVVPLVFSSLVVGIASMKDLKKMGRVGLKTILLILGSTVFSTLLGLALAYLFKPGQGVDIGANVEEIKTSSVSMIETILNIVPTNPIEAMAKTNILQVICFAVFLGIAIVMSKKRSATLLDGVEALAEAMYTLTNIVMLFAPIGVFALIAHVTATQGVKILGPLVAVILIVHVACFLQIVLIQAGLMAGALGRYNPILFLKKFSEALLFSYVSSSSSATLPISIKNVQNMGVSKSISSFIMPLGATINMNGTSIYQGIVVVFISQLYGYDLSTSQLFTIIGTTLLASIGTAGIPGAGLVMLTLILSSIGFPIDGIAIIAGIDRLLDAARTAANVCGDAAISVVIAHSENEFHPEAPITESSSS